jgi:hypothetical protein
VGQFHCLHLLHFIFFNENNKNIFFQSEKVAINSRGALHLKPFRTCSVLTKKKKSLALRLLLFGYRSRQGDFHDLGKVYSKLKGGGGQKLGPFLHLSFICISIHQGFIHRQLWSLGFIDLHKLVSEKKKQIKIFQQKLRSNIKSKSEQNFFQIWEGTTPSSTLTRDTPLVLKVFKNIYHSN